MTLLDLEVSQLDFGYKTPLNLTECRLCGEKFRAVEDRGYRYCLQCRKQTMKDFGLDDSWEDLSSKDRVRVAKRLWYLRHREEVIEYTKEYYYEHREKQKKLNLNRRRNRRSDIIKRKDGKCELCGFNDARALVLHHINGVDESNNRLSYLKEDYDLSKIQLLCRNCHAIIHYDDSPQN